MNKIITFLSLMTVLWLAAQPGSALAQQKRLSPHETISAVVGGGRVVVVYGRPYSKKPGTDVVRKIWGGLVPYGKVWRLGADEATLLLAQKPLKIGGASVPAGAYSLFLLPEEDGSAKLIISKDVGQWGEEYDESADLARVDLHRTTLDNPVDQFKITIGKNAGSTPPSGTLKFAWENTEYSVEFTPQ